MQRKKVEKLPLVNVEGERRFWSVDGKIMRNLADLEAALKDMTDASYGYHANQQKNDFAQWVGEVLGDGELAEKLRRAKTKQAAVKAVASALKKYYY